MFPGSTTKLSESTQASAGTISAKTDVIKLTGTVAINTILPNFGGGYSGILFLVPTGGAVTLSTSGNILTGLTMANNTAVMLIYVRSLAKWVIASAI